MNELTPMSSNHPAEKLNISEIYVKLIFLFHLSQHESQFTYVQSS